MKKRKTLWIGLGILIILSPFGLVLPTYFNAGSAWGEWSPAELGSKIGYIPAEMQIQNRIWKAPLPDYVFKAQGTVPVHSMSISYIMSALFGVGAVVVITILFGKVIAQRDKPDAS